MKVLVTGSNGFVGSALVETLLTQELPQGIEVRAMMRQGSNATNLKGLSFERVEASLSDFESLKKAVKQVDVVYHVAGAISAPRPKDYFEANTMGTKRLAQAVSESESPIKRFVFVSTLAAGGPVENLQPRQEEDQDQPVSNYGKSKLEAEKELLKFKDKFPITILRPPMVYGPRDRATFVFYQTVSRNFVPLIAGKTPDRHKYYSAIHIKDLCRGIIKASFSETPSGEIFYLTADEIFTYDQMMSTIAKHLHKKPMKLRVPKSFLTVGAYSLSLLTKITGRSYPLNLDKLSELLPDYWICSSQKARKSFGFAPEISLSDGLLDAIKWYKAESWL